MSTPIADDAARRGGVVRRPLAMGGTTPRIYYYMTHHYRGQTPNTVDKTNPVATTSRGQGYVDDDLDQGVDNGAGVFPRPSSSFETGETPRSSKGSEIDRGEDQEQEQDSDNGESETTSSGYSEKIINDRPRTSLKNLFKPVFSGIYELGVWFVLLFSRLLSAFIVADYFLVYSVRRTFQYLASKSWIRLLAILLLILGCLYLYHKNFGPHGPTIHPVPPIDEARIRKIADDQVTRRFSTWNGGPITSPTGIDMAQIDSRITANNAAQDRKWAERQAGLERSVIDVEARMRSDITSRLKALQTDLRQENTAGEERILGEVRRSLKEQLENLTAIVSSSSGGDSTVGKVELQLLEARLNQKVDTVTQGLRTEVQSREAEKAAFDELKRTIEKLLAMDDTTSESLTELRKTLAQLQDFSKQLEGRIAASQSSLSSRLDELAKDSITSAVLKAELSKLRLSQQDEERVISSAVERVLTRWTQEKASILRSVDEQLATLKDQIKDATANPNNGQPTTRPVDLPSSEQIVTKERARIERWVQDLLEKELPAAIKVAVPAQPKQASPEEVVTQARALISSWIEETFGQMVLSRLEESERRLLRETAKAVAGEAEARKADLDKFGGRIEQIAGQQQEISSTQNNANKRLDDLERKKSSAEIGPEHLTEVIRLLRKQYPNLSFGGSTHQGSGTHSGSGTGLTWDEVRQMMDEELERFSADRINMTDHALESTGARIMAQYTSSPYPSGFLASLKGRTGENPVVMLMPSTARGHCWAFAGDKGNATILLSAMIVPTAVTIDHISSGVAVNVDSAPRDFQIIGYKHRSDIAAKRGILLGEFRYDANAGRQVQTFYISPEAQGLASSGLQYVRLAVTSNHGNEEYTCIYRFRVHGIYLGQVQDDADNPVVSLSKQVSAVASYLTSFFGSST